MATVRQTPTGQGLGTKVGIKRAGQQTPGVGRKTVANGARGATRNILDQSKADTHRIRPGCQGRHQSGRPADTGGGARINGGAHSRHGIVHTRGSGPRVRAGECTEEGGEPAHGSGGRRGGGMHSGYRSTGRRKASDDLRPEGGDLRREGRVVLAEARRSRFRRRELGRHLCELRGKGLDVVIKLKGGCLAARALLLRHEVGCVFDIEELSGLLRGLTSSRNSEATACWESSTWRVPTRHCEPTGSALSGTKACQPSSRPRYSYDSRLGTCRCAGAASRATGKSDDLWC